MSKLPMYKPEELLRILLKKGFIMDRVKGSHKILYNEASNKRAVIPFHKKDLPKGTFFEILRQAGISKEDI